jgi:hypothetical protein
LLRGDGGRDRLTGGRDADILAGGPGLDWLELTDPSDLLYSEDEPLPDLEDLIQSTLRSEDGKPFTIPQGWLGVRTAAAPSERASLPARANSSGGVRHVTSAVVSSSERRLGSHQPGHPANADLTISSMTASPNPVGVADSFTLTVQVQDLGAAAANDVVVLLDLRPGMSVPEEQTGSGVHCTVAGTTARFAFATLPAGAAATGTCNIELTPEVSPNPTLTGTVGGGTPNDPVPPHNNTASVIIQTTRSDLAVDKTGPISIANGGRITYEIHIVHDSDSQDDATGVTVYDELPPGLPNVSTSVPCTGTQYLTCEIGSIPRGAAEMIITISADVNVWPGSLLYNYVRVSSGNESDPSNNVDSVVTVVTQGPPCTVSAVDWASVHSGLFPNPHPLFPRGQSLFPDKLSPADVLTRNTVRVRASVSPALIGYAVYLRAFDVDDPDARLGIDPQGDAGLDNNGKPKRGRFVPSNAARASQMTDGSGVAELLYEVTMQPGDNFRIAAVCDAVELDKLQVENPLAQYYVHPDSSQVTGFNGVVSDMLTVWRRLWVEIDSMRAVVRGAPDEVANRGVRWIQVVSPPSYYLEVANGLQAANFYAGGEIIASDGTRVDIAANNATQITIVGALPSNSQAFIGPITVTDDDDRMPPGRLTPLPRLSPLTSQVADRFKPAYIQPISVAGGALNPNPLVPFKLNAAVDARPITRNEDMRDEPGFWVQRLVFAYQPADTQDRDPNSESAVMGLTSDSRRRSAVYIEVIRDYLAEAGKLTPANLAVSIDAVTAHEMGHTPRADHPDGGIMQQYSNVDANPPFLADFTAATIWRFRRARRWQGG